MFADTVSEASMGLLATRAVEYLLRLLLDLAYMVEEDLKLQEEENDSS
jgi:hypothetical protein